mmetsp:Transcript_6940/g.15843  ORF Transcript_6940/g.15843 Transcript_6940/m.15843 type:complete len:107 (+) Transcript_6940:1005-1325(+)
MSIVATSSRLEQHLQVLDIVEAWTVDLEIEEAVVVLNIGIVEAYLALNTGIVEVGHIGHYKIDHDDHNYSSVGSLSGREHVYVCFAASNMKKMMDVESHVNGHEMV